MKRTRKPEAHHLFLRVWYFHFVTSLRQVYRMERLFLMPKEYPLLRLAQTDESRKRYRIHVSSAEIIIPPSRPRHLQIPPVLFQPCRYPVFVLAYNFNTTGVYELLTPSLCANLLTTPFCGDRMTVSIFMDSMLSPRLEL